MKVRSILPVLAAAGLLLGACKPATAPAPSETLSVTGTGHVTVPPNIITLTLGVQTRGSDIGAAVAENSRTAEQVMASLANAGVAPEDMQTAYFNVYTQVRYDEFGSPTDEVTYFVENTLTAVLRDTSQLSAALQGALDQGVNSVQNVTYGLDDSAAALDEARTLAISDAQRQAELLAQAAGTQLGDLIAVTDFSGGPAYYLEASTTGKGGAAAGVPSAPGTLTYQAQVGLTYSIR